jgi:hypothetical protein
MIKCDFCSNEAVAKIGLPSLNAKWACSAHFADYRDGEAQREKSPQSPSLAETDSMGTDPSETGEGRIKPRT